MTNEETAEAIQFLSDTWAQRPMADGTARIWGAKLSHYPRADVMRVLTQFAYASKWRPSLAEILSQLDPKPQESASAALASVKTALIYPPGERDAKISGAARETVRRLGGWGVIGQWKTENWGIHARDFERVHRDVREAPPQTEKRLGMGAGILRSLAGGKVEAG